MSYFPYEITMIILSNLPVKSLVRFKCVSKSWHSWISSPNFELNQRREGAISTVYSRLICSPKPSFRLINQQLTLEELNYPLRHEEIDKILCSYHGLILFNVNEHIYLWNPATRFCTKVLELDNLGGYYTRGGLCFDSSKNVYKAVLIMDHKSPDYGGEFVLVASLKDKQWRQLKFPYDIRSTSEGITLEGRLHHRVRVKNSCFENNDGEDDDNDGNNELEESNKVIYFDPISEKFHMFPVPEPKFDQQEIIIVGLGVLNQCLCIMTCLEDDKGGVEILVMKEYGAKESWTSLFFIKNLEINPSYEFTLPFSVTETGEVALIIDNFDKGIVVYNPKNDSMRDILIVEREAEFTLGPMVTYVESLISPEEYYWSEEQHKMFGTYPLNGIVDN